MTTDTRSLPLFAWKPECKFIPFPMASRIGRIRDTAAKMLDKPTEKSAEHYRRQVNEAISAHLGKIGLDHEGMEAERAEFWRAVEGEMRRQSYGWLQTHGPDDAP